MTDKERCELAIRLISSINSRHGAGSEWNLADLSPAEQKAYDSALELLASRFKL